MIVGEMVTLSIQNKDGSFTGIGTVIANYNPEPIMIGNMGSIIINGHQLKPLPEELIQYKNHTHGWYRKFDKPNKRRNLRS